MYDSIVTITYTLLLHPFRRSYAEQRETICYSLLCCVHERELCLLFFFVVYEYVLIVVELVEELRYVYNMTRYDRRFILCSRVLDYLRE